MAKYTDAHAAQLEELCEDYYMTEARRRLKKACPELRGMLKTDAQGHCLLRRWRKKKRSLPKLSPSEMLNVAERMREEDNMTVEAIFEHLKREYPTSVLPAKSKIQSHLSKKSKNGSGKMELKTVFPDGTEMVIRTSAKKLMKVVRELLGGE